MLKNIFMFPGQGSQKKGMGSELFEFFPDLVERASAILGYSLIDLCLGISDQPIEQTQYTQPALYCVNALHSKDLHKKGIFPHGAMGHSLGEYNALLEANVFDFETGLILVKKRGEIMSQASKGTMISIIGLSIEEIQMILKKRKLDRVDIAAHNSKFQSVLSCSSSDSFLVISTFKEEKAKKIIPLNVSGAFHSRQMNEAKKEFQKFLNQFIFKKPMLPVLSNATACFYKENDVVKNLSEQLTHTVLWFDSMVKVKDEKTQFFEVGPGRVLQGLLKRLF